MVNGSISLFRFQLRFGLSRIRNKKEVLCMQITLFKCYPY